MLLKLIQMMESGRFLAHIIFSAAFIYDIVGNNNDFGWDNAGIYAAATFGGEAILALAKLKYGANNAVDTSEPKDGGLRPLGDGADSDNPADKPLARKSKRAGRDKNRAF